MTPQPAEAPTTEPTQTPAPTETPEPAATVPLSSTEIPATPDLATYGEVASYRLNLRSGPGAKHQIVQVLLNGDRLEILARAPDRIWLQVIAPDGTEGWVNSGYVSITEGAANELPVVEPAPPG
jgi:uncharacterized protein YgiM (DUF1202 family)